MSEWLNQAFSGGVSLTRANPFGIGLMILAIILIAVSRPLSNHWPGNGRSPSAQNIKLAGLLLCALGTAIAIL